MLTNKSTNKLLRLKRWIPNTTLWNRTTHAPPHAVRGNFPGYGAVYVGYILKLPSYWKNMPGLGVPKKTQGEPWDPFSCRFSRFVVELHRIKRKQ